MSKPLVKVYIHIVFSTDKRERLITPAMEEPLHDYIGEICKAWKCWPVKIGSHRNHLHIVCGLDVNMHIKKIVWEIKASSSRWLSSEFGLQKRSFWEEEYACFSVGENELSKLIHYVNNQSQHHANMSYEDEIKRLIMEDTREFDELYLWNGK